MYCRLLSAIVLIPWLALWLSPVQVVYAAGVVVTATTDDVDLNGNCTLREAVKAVNTGVLVDQCDGRSGGKEIFLQPGQVYRLTLRTQSGKADTQSDGDLDILTGISLIGDPLNKPVIDASGLGDRVLHVQSSSLVTLIGLEIYGGVVTGTDAQLRGGGIYVQSGSVYLASVSIRGNVSDNVGGGIFVEEGSSVTFNGGTITSNQAVAGGGVFSYGSFSMYSSSLTDNLAVGSNAVGAGIYNGGLSGGFTRVVNSTVSGNSIPESLNNHTAGIYSAGRLVLENVTIIDNQGVGLQITTTQFASNSVVKNTIIARQKNLQNCILPAGGGVALYGKHNLSDDTSCLLNAAVDVVLHNPSASGISLSPDSYGTQTLMYGLEEDSPALGKGADCQGFDQRGLVRKPACDIGSFELNGTAPYFTRLPLIVR